MNRQFDHEKLNVYQIELKYIEWVTDFIESIKNNGVDVRIGEVIKQLDRASLSILLNTAEGNGKRRKQGRAKFFDDARGSATECAACLDALIAKKVCRSDEVNNEKAFLIEIVSMLSGLIRYFDKPDSTEEDKAKYEIIEDE